MGCFYPLPATQLPGGGIVVHKRTPGIHQHVTPAHLGRDIKLPCGNCTGCRLDRSKTWAIRLMHEAQTHERCAFLTLTYSNETLRARRAPTWEPTVPYTPPSELAPHWNVTSNGSEVATLKSPSDSLSKCDVQLFMKRLRKELTTRDPSARVRYYLVGEYGDLTGRPHYHIALFGEDFSGDRKLWRTSGDYLCYRSPRLEKLWTYGNSEIGELTYESAAYLARYILKKVNGKRADEHYRRTDQDGNDFWIQSEFSLMSRGGKNGHGIGYGWMEQWHEDVYPHDYVVINGRKLKPPRYYDKIQAEFDPVKMEVVKMMREQRAKDLAEDNTPERLQAKEIYTLAKLRLKKRNLE